MPRLVHLESKIAVTFVHPHLSTKGVSPHSQNKKMNQKKICTGEQNALWGQAARRKHN